MGDWNIPINTTAYADVLDDLKDRDFDAISLCLNNPTNPLVGMIKLLRSPVKFQERGASTWDDLVLTVAGGGTGGATQSAARTGLGLGTISVQDNNTVNITGGTLAGTGSGLTDLSAANITSGGTLPNLNGSNLTNLNASALQSGTLPDARFPANLPAIGGAALTTLNASSLSTGTVNVARLGSGATAAKFLRGDNTWQTVAVIRSVTFVDIAITAGGDVTISPALTDYLKAVGTFIGIISTSGGAVSAKIVSNTIFRVANVNNMNGTLSIIEFM